MSEIALSVNGEPATCAPDTRLPDLLDRLGFDPRTIAVEYNGEILHRQFWETTRLQGGDRLEIVTIVGGGGGLIPRLEPRPRGECGRDR